MHLVSFTALEMVDATPLRVHARGDPESLCLTKIASGDKRYEDRLSCKIVCAQQGTDPGPRGLIQSSRSLHVGGTYLPARDSIFFIKNGIRMPSRELRMDDLESGFVIFRDCGAEEIPSSDMTELQFRLTCALYEVLKMPIKHSERITPSKTKRGTQLGTF